MCTHGDGFVVSFDNSCRHRGESLSDVMHGIVTLAARLMTQTIACASGAGGVAAVKMIDQGAGAGDTPCYRWPEVELVEGRGCGVDSELQFDYSGLGGV